MDAPGDGYSEIIRELELGGALDSGVQILGGAIGVDVSKEIRRFDGVLSGTRLGEVVRSKD